MRQQFLSDRSQYLTSYRTFLSDIHRNGSDSFLITYFLIPFNGSTLYCYRQPTNSADRSSLVKPDVSFFMYSAFKLILKKIGKEPAVNLKKAKP
jgi:hypothetical protein